MNGRRNTGPAYTVEETHGLLNVSLHRQFDYLEVALADPQWQFDAIRVGHHRGEGWLTAWPLDQFGNEWQTVHFQHGPLVPPRKRKRADAEAGIVSGAFTHKYQGGPPGTCGVQVGIVKPEHGRFVKVRMALDDKETADPLMIAYNLIRGGWCIMARATADKVEEQVPGLYVPGWRQVCFVEATPESIQAQVMRRLADPSTAEFRQAAEIQKRGDQVGARSPTSHS